MLRLGCGAAGNGNVCHGHLEIKVINVDLSMPVQSRCLCCIPRSPWHLFGHKGMEDAGETSVKQHC